MRAPCCWTKRTVTQLPMYQRARKGVSYLPQEPSVFRKLSVEDNLMAILQTLPISGRERRERMMRLIFAVGSGNGPAQQGLHAFGRRTAACGDRTIAGAGAELSAAG